MRRALTLGYVVALVALAPALGVGLLLWNGAISAPIQLGLPDPGALTRFGLPISRALRDVSAAATIGALVMASITLAPASAAAHQGTGLRARMLGFAAWSGLIWSTTGLAYLLFTYADLVGKPPFSPGAWSQLRYFMTDFDLGRSLLVSSILAGTAALGSLFARRIGSIGILAVVALAALWPLGLTGHAAGAANHDLAVNVQFLHLVGVTVWFGGLIAVVLVRAHSGDRFATIVSRYSTLAGWCFAVVAFSGVVAAALRLRTWSALVSDYGVLLILKTLALVLLGLAGYLQRRRLLPHLGASRGQRRAFVKLAGLELLLMATATGVAMALTRTPPPADEGLLSTAESLLGYPLPPALGAAEWFSQWRIDMLWTPLAVVALGWYVVAMRRLHRRRDRWPWGRLISWSLGCLMLIWATSGSPAVYGKVLFSMHMVQHMTIGIAIPAFLVLGAPVTLALRTLPARQDGSRGPREWLLALVHSRFAGFLGHPLVAAIFFIGSLVVFYSSALFELSLRTHTGHTLMTLHFLLAGYLFASAIAGADPGPRRPAYPFRALLLMVTFGFHALFSVSLMSKTTVMAETWFSALDRTWGSSLERDQYVGASIGWALGDYPLLILGAAVIWSWVKADHREARRYDRKAARDGDQDLHEYNAHLQQLARRRPE